MLAAVTCYYNPVGYTRLRDNYLRFRDTLPHNLKLVTVEMSFSGEWLCQDSIRISASDLNNMWQKERLLNIGIASLPAEYDKVAWLDADLIWGNQRWVEETEEKLDQFAVVQLFEHILMLDESGVSGTWHHGHAYARCLNDPSINIRKPGGAWAARRDVIPEGLEDTHVLGGSDGMMLAAWEANWSHYSLGRLTPRWKETFLHWAARAHERVRGNIGFVSGEVTHFWHGAKENRRYVERWQYLTDHAFEPDRDIKVGSNGLWEWATHKPEMHAKVAQYFRERRDDG